MKKKDIYLVLGILLLAVAGWLIYGLFDRGSAVEIRLHGEVYETVSQGQVETVIITQPDGKENRIRLDEKGVWMEHSTCDNQICVNTGKILFDQEQGLSLPKSIVCLPNGVTVELVGVEAGE